MSQKRFLQSRAESRCYTREEVCERLKLSRSTFFHLKKAGRLPLVELLPRLGRITRYHAEPVDRYLAGRGIRRPA